MLLEKKNLILSGKQNTLRSTYIAAQLSERDWRETESDMPPIFIPFWPSFHLLMLQKSQTCLSIWKACDFLLL